MALEQSLDAVNNMNVKIPPDLVWASAINQLNVLNSIQNGHLARLNTISESNVGAICENINQLGITEAAAVSRVHRTPSGDTLTDIAAAIAVATAVLDKATPA